MVKRHVKIIVALDQYEMTMHVVHLYIRVRVSSNLGFYSCRMTEMT